MIKKSVLSPREQEILTLVSEGMTNREVAHKLNISPNTVKVHLRNIFDKAAVASRTEAVLFAMEHGIIDMPGSDITPEAKQPIIQEKLMKYRWIWLAIVLLLIALGVTLFTNVLMPDSLSEPITLAELPERWQELASLPEKLKGMAAVAYDGEIYVFGGEGQESIRSDLFRYVPAEDRWEKLKDKPTPVSDVRGVLIGERIYVPGGRLANGNTTDVLEIYDPRKNTWNTGSSLPIRISAYALVNFEGKMYLFGGWNGEEAITDVYVYDPDEDIWRVKTNMAISRQKAAAVSLADKIILLGGSNKDGRLSEVLAYYPSRDSNDDDPWEILPELPESLFGLDAVSVSDRILVIGGKLNQNMESTEVLAYQFENGVWTLLASGIDFVNPQLSLVQIGSEIYSLFPDEECIMTKLWCYKAIFYEIYVPFVQ